MDGAIIEPAEKNWGEGNFDMLPSAFVDGGKKADEFVVVCDVVEKMSKRANKGNNNR